MHWDSSHPELNCNPSVLSVIILNCYFMADDDELAFTVQLCASLLCLTVSVKSVQLYIPMTVRKAGEDLMLPARLLVLQ